MCNQAREFIWLDLQGHRQESPYWLSVESQAEESTMHAGKPDDPVAAQPKKMEATETEGSKMQHPSKGEGLEAHLELPV